MTFIKANNLAGAFIWSIDLDDFLGTQCDQGVYPLMSSIKNELTNKLKSNVKKNLIRLLLKSNANVYEYKINIMFVMSFMLSFLFNFNRVNEPLFGGFHPLFYV